MSPSLILWPLAAVALCAAVSLYRGPYHYTKFMVPYAYRFKADPGWIFVAVLLALGGLTYHHNGLGLACLIAGCVIAFLRVVIWLNFRFPLVSWFVLMFIVFLFGIGWRGRFF